MTKSWVYKDEEGFYRLFGPDNIGGFYRIVGHDEVGIYTLFGPDILGGFYRRMEPYEIGYYRLAGPDNLKGRYRVDGPDGLGFYRLVGPGDLGGIYRVDGPDDLGIYRLAGPDNSNDIYRAWRSCCCPDINLYSMAVLCFIVGFEPHESPFLGAPEWILHALLLEQDLKISSLCYRRVGCAQIECDDQASMDEWLNKCSQETVRIV
jgi:hypothetical protein